MSEHTRISVKFETESCSRCGGSGSYSWCSRFGSTCFKCGGQKTQLTKKGAKAAERYAAVKAALLSIPTSRVREGMRLFVDEPGIEGLSRGVRGYFRVRSVGRTTSGCMVARTAAERESCGAFFYPWKPGDNWLVDLGPKAGSHVVGRNDLWQREPSVATLDLLAEHMKGVDGATVTLESSPAEVSA